MDDIFCCETGAFAPFEDEVEIPAEQQQLVIVDETVPSLALQTVGTDAGNPSPKFEMVRKQCDQSLDPLAMQTVDESRLKPQTRLKSLTTILGKSGKSKKVLQTPM